MAIRDTFGDQNTFQAVLGRKQSWGVKECHGQFGLWEQTGAEMAHNWSRTTTSISNSGVAGMAKECGPERKKEGKRESNHVLSISGYSYKVNWLLFYTKDFKISKDNVPRTLYTYMHLRSFSFETTTKKIELNEHHL